MTKAYTHSVKLKGKVHYKCTLFSVSGKVLAMELYP